MRRVRDLKFGAQMQSGNVSKNAKRNSEKGRGLKQQKSFFSEKLIERTDEKAISSFHQLF